MTVTVVLLSTTCRSKSEGDAPVATSSAESRREEAACRNAASCEVAGECVPGATGCKAAHDADCERSTFCKRHGRCRLRNDRCEAVENGDCAESDDCKQSGQCVAREGKCIATDDEDCKASEGCASLGKCRADKDGKCVATSEGCAGSNLCRKQRACTEDNGRCVARPEDCRKWLCSSIGACSVNPQDGLCYAGSDADCRGSTGCKKQKECTARDGRCVASGSPQ